jgi:hypothetical protein
VDLFGKGGIKMEGSYADHYTTNASRGINMETRGFTISSTIDNDILV